MFHFISHSINVNLVAFSVKIASKRVKILRGLFYFKKKKNKFGRIKKINLHL
jgi:hypothetical protein